MPTHLCARVGEHAGEIGTPELHRTSIMLAAAALTTYRSMHSGKLSSEAAIHGEAANRNPGTPPWQTNFLERKPLTGRPRCRRQSQFGTPIRGQTSTPTTRADDDGPVSHPVFACSRKVGEERLPVFDDPHAARCQIQVYPASALRIAPVSRLDASEARNCTTDAISCGCPIRLAGVISNQRDTSPGWLSSPCSSGVSI